MLHGIPKASNCKYLGDIIIENITNNDYTSKQYNKCYAQGNALIGKFYMCRKCSKYTGTLFKSYCSSLYACRLWNCCRAKSIKHCVYHTIMS